LVTRAGIEPALPA